MSKNPNKPESQPIVFQEESIHPSEKFKKAQEAKLEKTLKDYEKRRGNVLRTLDEFKKADDMELAAKAQQYENLIQRDTKDPDVLRALRDTTEKDVKENIAMLMTIVETQIQKDRKLAEWMESREREKIAATMERYNYLRKISLKEVKSLKNYMWDSKVYDTLVQDLEEGFPEIKPEEVRTAKKAQEIILELTKAMNRFKPQLEQARVLKNKHYETAFYHAIGRAIDRNLASSGGKPAVLEEAVKKELERITSIDIAATDPSVTWRITYEDYTFSVAKRGEDFIVKMT